jgi:hypothetical protein
LGGTHSVADGRRKFMSHDKTKRGVPGRSRISLSDHGVRHCAQRVRVSKEHVAVAMQRVGNSAAALPLGFRK